jgi:hypothetical protein
MPLVRSVSRDEEKAPADAVERVLKGPDRVNSY